MSKISSIFLLHFSQKRFLNTISTPTLPLASVSTIEFLKNSSGLASQSSSSAGLNLQIHENNSQKYEATIGFLKPYGFENPQIADLVSRCPWILQSNTDLKPKVEFFQEIGFVGPLLTKLILSNPWVLRSSLDSQLKPSFFFLKEILESDKQVTAAICGSARLLTRDFKRNLKPNVDILVSEGVPPRNIAKLIAFQPTAMMQKVDRMIHSVKTVKELGIEPKAPMFIYAVKVMGSLSDSTLEKKINILKSFGWSEKEIFAAFKKFPLYLTCSEEKMRNVADFWFNTAKLDPGTLISYPMLFKCSLDKRLQPRYKVFEVLKMKNLLKNNNFGSLLVEGERRFVEKYVVKYLDKIPNLMDIYRGNVAAETKSNP